MSRKRKIDPQVLAAARDQIIEDWLTNAIDCLREGDGLGERHRAILVRALQRVAVQSIVNDADLLLLAAAKEKSR